jgi:hypothetical protein
MTTKEPDKPEALAQPITTHIPAHTVSGFLDASEVHGHADRDVFLQNARSACCQADVRVVDQGVQCTMCQAMVTHVAIPVRIPATSVVTARIEWI